MTVVNPKSISGINSITTGSGSDNLLTIHTSDASSTERVRINSSGDVIVGSGITVSPDGDIFATGVCTATSFSGDGSALTGITQTTINSNADNRLITGSGTANTLNAESNVNINGGILIAGHTASTTVSNGEGPFIQVKSTDSRGGISLLRHSANASGGGVYIAKSRNATIGSNTIVQSGDELGRITFSGDDGTDIHTQAASIKVHVDGTPGSNDMPGRLSFETTADGAASPTERITIKSGGDVGINSTAPQTAFDVLNQGQTGITDVMLVKNFSAGNGFIRFQDNDASSNFSLGVDDGSGLGANAFILYDRVNSAYRMGIDNSGNMKLHSGNLVIGTSGKGIDFSTTGDGTGSGSVSELLDDYEEGTWSPSGSWTTIAASYTKIGRMVHAGFSLRATATSGNVTIGNLPFTSGSTYGHTGGIAWGLCEFNTTDSWINGSVDDSSTTVTVRRGNATVVTFGSGNNNMNQNAFIRGMITYMAA